MSIKNRLKRQIKRYNGIFKTSRKNTDKRAYIIYTKRQHKKSNKIKKDVDKVSKGMLISYCRKARKQKLKSNLKLKSKWAIDIRITTPLGKRILKSISR